MPRFYGTIQGAHGPVSCLGHSGLLVTAQSFEGDILISLVKTNEGDKVKLAIRDHGHGPPTQLYFGFIRDLLDMEKRSAMMHALGVQKFLEGSKGDE